MAETLAGRKVLEVEAVAFLIAVVADAVVGGEHQAFPQMNMISRAGTDLA